MGARKNGVGDGAVISRSRKGAKAELQTPKMKAVAAMGGAADAAGVNKLSIRYRPQTREELGEWVKKHLKIVVPDCAVCPGHNSPMDYLWHAFGGDFARRRTGQRRRVWCGPIAAEARRSWRRSRRCWTAGLSRIARCGFWAGRWSSRRGCMRVRRVCAEGIRDGVAGADRPRGVPVRQRQRGADFAAVGPGRARGACAQAAVRRGGAVRAGGVGGGAVLHAEHGGNRGGGGGGQHVARAGGADAAGGRTRRRSRARRSFRWCMWETIEACGIGRAAGALWTRIARGRRDNRGGISGSTTRSGRCGGAAGRISRARCCACGPSRRSAVFEEFDPGVHVGPTGYDPGLPLYRAIDFGFVNPFVCLWIQVDREAVVRVIDEYVRRKATVAVHAEEIRRRTPCAERAGGGDFLRSGGSGAQRHHGDQPRAGAGGDGDPDAAPGQQFWMGLRGSGAHCGADGRVRLRIDPRCERLIEAMQCYHYPEATQGRGVGAAGQGRGARPPDRRAAVFFRRPKTAASRHAAELIKKGVRHHILEGRVDRSIR